MVEDNRKANKANEEMILFLMSQGVLKSKRLIEAFRRTPRHLFVKETDAPLAYRDIPLQLIKEETISQPSTVALMLELLELKEGDHVMEIGAGSGWNAALISNCVGSKGEVYTLEIDRDLTKMAEANIAKLNLHNIHIINKDGSNGHEADAPYDKIIYTASTKAVPDSVLKQLKVGGLLIAPIGGTFVQVLTLLRKTDEKKIESTPIGYFQFKPMYGVAG